MNKKEIIQQELSNMTSNHDRKLKKQTPCRIKYNGKFLTTHSKKTIWPSIGAAKSALRLHFETTANIYAYGYDNYQQYKNSFYAKPLYSYAEISQRREEFFDALYEEVEFVFV